VEATLQAVDSRVVRQYARLSGSFGADPSIFGL
jgi:hypothetical protein